MPSFRYRAYGTNGQLAQGDVDAVSPAAASDLLWQQGLTAFEMNVVESGLKPWWQRDLIGGDVPSQAELAAFTREFATLSAAEIPLDDALRILSEQVSSTRMRVMATRLLSDVLNGAALSDAMQRQPIFAAEYVSIVRAGEVGGSLSRVLGELADLLERREEVRARIRSASTYPAILIALSLVSVVVIVGGLIPAIAPVFIQGGRPMPAGIAALVALNERWVEIVIGLVAVVAVAGIAALVALQVPQMRLAWDRRKLRLPMLGGFVLDQDTARFARTLGTLLAAGVPLLQAATSARAVVRNGHVAAGLESTIESVRQGRALHDAIHAEGVLPPAALRMIAVGEQAGKLDKMLLRVAEMLEKQTQRSIEKFMTLFTPVLTVTIAVLVGGLILTVISAVLSVNELAVR